jgi:coenzyme F420-dependent glucose-6-phosphate dehydrogenase
MRYFYGAAHEQFPPEDLLRQAIEAARGGFDGIGCSDHLQPWWEPGESGQAWIWLGAVGRATQRVAIGTAVTPPGPRYHPALIAQAWATLERLFPGRPFLGFGSGESLNESPLGAEWPPPPDQVDRMEEALEMINALFAGERVTLVAPRSTCPHSGLAPRASPLGRATGCGHSPIPRRLRM